MKITIEEIHKFLKGNETKLTFEKLRNKNHFYTLVSFKNDEIIVKATSQKTGNDYYKKSYISEIVTLHNHTNTTIKRIDFNNFCPKSKNAPCNFCVIVRLLEQMGKVKYENKVFFKSN
jgi:hypothetical protein